MDASRRILARACLLAALAGLGLPSAALAGNKNTPTSKIYCADVDGDTQIDTGEKVDDLTKRSVYNADGVVIETKPKGTNAMVFSNGTGVFFDEDTRMEVRKFQQEPFVPNRTDMDVEPSVSQTQNYVPQGTVGLCTSKLVAGSTMTYQTPLGSVNINGGKLVVSSQNNQTVISMIDGESTVNAGDIDTGGQTLKNGQQAVITPGQNGAPPSITIQNIPQNQVSSLDDKVTMACNAKKTVYFETQAAPTSIVPTTSGSSTATTRTASTNSSSSGSITAFDGNDGVVTTNNTPTGPTNTTPPEQIVAVPVAPSSTPVQYTTSNANITTTTSGTP